jgi:NAD+ synthase (glutamine-hydrolysing)
MRICIAQINTVVGDIEYNLSRSILAYNQGRILGADLVVFPELTLTGYPPEDLLFREDFLDRAEQAMEEFASHTTRCAAIIGVALKHFSKEETKCFNTAAVCYDGKKQDIYFKMHLPNYGVFDEKRYFIPGLPLKDNPIGVFEINGKKVGVSICEDLWVGDESPAIKQAPYADVLVNLSASPYHRGRLVDREDLVSKMAVRCGKPVVYANLVGGQDELIFDGASLVFNEKGEQVAGGLQFQEENLMVYLPLGDPNIVEDGPFSMPMLPEEEVYTALVLGTRDYVLKNGFKQVILGLSGGVDSALVAHIAADALGPENVFGILMPSRYSSDGSITDALQLAQNIGIKTRTWNINDVHMYLLKGMREVAYGRDLDGLFLKRLNSEGNSEENIQARARGNMLMALSNLSGAMVLTTGNKSEMAVGYATLYGDMAGGFAVIKDVPKTLVFKLCEWLNDEFGDRIPQTILDKPPSAELRPDQKDTDSLPPYEVLDPIIELYVEQDQSAETICKTLAPKPDGPLDLMMVQRVCKMIDRNEYKRRQAPPGIRITPKAFGRGRRLPIVNGWTN